MTSHLIHENYKIPSNFLTKTSVQHIWRYKTLYNWSGSGEIVTVHHDFLRVSHRTIFEIENSFYFSTKIL